MVADEHGLAGGLEAGEGKRLSELGEDARAFYERDLAVKAGQAKAARLVQLQARLGMTLEEAAALLAPVVAPLVVQLVWAEVEQYVRDELARQDKWF